MCVCVCVCVHVCVSACASRNKLNKIKKIETLDFEGRKIPDRAGAAGGSPLATRMAAIRSNFVNGLDFDLFTSRFVD